MTKARITLNREAFWFASVDGEDFIELNREPRAEDRLRIKTLLEDKSDNRPLHVAKRWLEHREAEFSEL